MQDNPNPNLTDHLTLGIETSCDETALAIYSDRHGIVGEVLRSQVDIHAALGGVVPELAARDHFAHLGVLLRQLLKQTNLTLADLNAIGCTQGPGLIGALRVGIAFAQGLGAGLRIPTIGIHHMEGHLLVSELMQGEAKVPLPHLALLVSGGHTMLVGVAGRGEYEILGQTLDDAAGEAFDKGARLLGLGYPGGPAVEQCASDYTPSYTLPSPMLHKGLDFSFSGLKTALLYKMRDLDLLDPDLKPKDLAEVTDGHQIRGELAASYQEAIVQALVTKCRRALRPSAAQVRNHKPTTTPTPYRALVAGGGVACNTLLRERLQKVCNEVGVALFLPPLSLCTDNGAMIAYAARQRLLSCNPQTSEPANIIPKPRYPISELPPL